MAADGDIVETELKYLAPDLQAVRARLQQAGATLSQPRQPESNTVFDDDDASLRKSERLLRLRNGRELTVKLPLLDERFKSMHEITVMVEGPVEELLDGLGYRVAFRYEKYREAWDLEGMFVTLDELPFLGAVVEIEGDGSKIPDTAVRLGLEDLPTSTSNYLALFVEYAREHGLPDGTFMTFAAEAAAAG